MSKDTDQISRDKIRTDIHHNFFVEAGAGSGKTSVLADRMVAMVEGGIDISKISAITFTKAAAGEFYSRFQQKLSESKSAYAEKALKDIDLCFMGTIDSFCNMVLSEHPAEAGIPSDAAVITEEEAELLYLREYSKIMKGASGDPELEKKAERFRNTFWDPQSVFQNGMRMLASSGGAEFIYNKPPEGKPDAVFGRRREKVIEILKALYAHPELLSDDNKASRDASQMLSDKYELLTSSWDEEPLSVKNALKKMNGFRLLPEFEDKQEILGPGWEHFFIKHEGRKKWFEVNTDNDPFLSKALEDYIYSVAADFLDSCAESIADTLRKEGKLTFSDYLLYLRDLLRKDASEGGKLTGHIYNRHSYFLIDEFQDTDPIQAEIFFYLTAKEPKSDWKECVPRQGSLFIVGDPKQSIYRFRSADVSSFLRVREMFRDPEIGEVLEMYRNFRSSGMMSGWFNEVFSELLPEDTDVQSKFSLIPTEEKPEYKGTLGGAYSYDVTSSISASGREDHFRVAEIIRKIVDDPNITIQGRENDDVPRRPEYRDFMIITPTKSNLRLYMNALSELGIPFRIEGKVLFNECEPLKALAYLMAAAADPYDGKALFAAEHLSGCSVTPEDVRSFAARTRNMPPSAVFTMLLEENRVFARAGAHNAEYVYFALELLREAETTGVVSSMKDAAGFISGLVNDASGEERCIQLRRDSNRVHIANLHKVKGLEAPIVMLADPFRRGHDPSQRVDHSEEPPKRYVFSIQGKSPITTNEFADELEKEKAVLAAEDTRLLYVAATRAENALIISAARTVKGELASSNPWMPLLNHTDKRIFGLLGSAEVTVPSGPVLLDVDALYDKAESESVLNDRAPLAPTYEIRLPSKAEKKRLISSENVPEEDSPAASERADAEEAAGPEASPVTAAFRAIHPKHAALFGTLVHRLMEVLVSSRNTVDLDAAVNEIVLDYNVSYDEFGEILKRIGETMRRGGFEQTNGVPQDILAELLAADEVHCECPFCYRDGETVWHGVMDVVYNKDGAWHIVDYKTNADPDDLDALYQEQLQAYVKAFAELTGETADARTYHIRTDA